MVVSGVCLVDAVIPPASDSLLVAGALDELAHLATAIVFLSVLRLGPSASIVALLMGSVALDIDHVPGVLGWDGLTEGSARPYSHSFATVADSFATVAVVLAASTLYPPVRRLAAALALGVTVHLWRDLSTGEGSGVPLLWPFARDPVAVPYEVYVASLIALVLVRPLAGLTQSRRPPPGGKGEARRGV